MKTILIATIIASAFPAFAGNPKLFSSPAPAPTPAKPNWICNIPVLRSTPLCNTYNEQMARRFAPQLPSYPSYYPRYSK